MRSSHTGLVYPFLLIVNPLRRLRKSVSRNAQSTDSIHTIPECRIQEFAKGMLTMRHSNSAMLCRVGKVSLKYLRLVKQHTMTRNMGFELKVGDNDVIFARSQDGKSILLPVQIRSDWQPLPQGQ